MKDIYKMELHDEDVIRQNSQYSLYVIAVPNGWIYTQQWETAGGTHATSTFVPRTIDKEEV